MPTQHDKILDMCSDGHWHCAIEFWNLYIRSPHKRRAELEEQGHKFERMKCSHGQRLCFDYRIIQREPVQEKLI